MSLIILSKLTWINEDCLLGGGVSHKIRVRARDFIEQLTKEEVFAEWNSFLHCRRVVKSRWNKMKIV